jgi:hypothetical protein
MFDKNLLLRDGTTDITSTTTGSVIDFGVGGDIRELTYLMIVQSVSGTSPTLDMVIQTSDAVGMSPLQDSFTFPQINAAGIYAITFRSPHRYRRLSWTIGGSGTPTFVNVLVGPVLAGEYSNF